MVSSASQRPPFALSMRPRWVLGCIHLCFLASANFVGVF